MMSVELVGFEPAKPTYRKSVALLDCASAPF